MSIKEYLIKTKNKRDALQKTNTRITKLNKKWSNLIDSLIHIEKQHEFEEAVFDEFLNKNEFLKKNTEAEHLLTQINEFIELAKLMEESINGTTDNKN